MHNHTTRFPKSCIAMLLFLGGFTNNIVPTLITFLSIQHHFEHWQAVLLQSTFFINFLITVIPGWVLVKQKGYRKTIVYGLMLCTISSLILAISIETQQVAFFFPVVFLLALGTTLIRITVTPLLITFQQEKNYQRNTSLLLCSDTIGALISPTLSSYCIFLTATRWPIQSASLFFVGLSGFYCLLMQYILSNSFHQETTDISIDLNSLLSTLRQPLVQSGFVATFIFIGLEFSIPIFISLAAQESTPGNPHIGAFLISCYWSLLLIGRLLSLQLLNRVSGSQLIIYGSVTCLSIILLSAQTGYFTYALTTTGLINSFMYPCIFSIYTQRTPRTQHFITSSVFLIAFSGGAFVPFIQALVAKTLSTTQSFVVIVMCYALLITTVLTSMKSQTATTPQEQTA